jgi:hypothetical protein
MANFWKEWNEVRMQRMRKGKHTENNRRALVLYKKSILYNILY